MRENQNSKLSTKEWMGKYLYSDLHEYFFFDFSIILYEWLAQLTYWKTNFQGDEKTCWTPELIQQLQEVDNRASRIIEVCLDKILEGYITKFTINIVKSYGSGKREFFEGTKGRLLLYLQLWIKMLICEKGGLKMNSNE